MYILLLSKEFFKNSFLSKLQWRFKLINAVINSKAHWSLLRWMQCMLTFIVYLKEGIKFVNPVRNLKWIVITQKLICFKINPKYLLCSALLTSGKNLVFLLMRNSNSQRWNCFTFLSFKNWVLSTELDMVPAQWVLQSTMPAWFSFCSNSVLEHRLVRKLVYYC